MQSGIFPWQISRHSLAAALLAVSMLFAAAAHGADVKATAAKSSKVATKETSGEASKAAGQKPRVVDLSAEWCVPCKKFHPSFEKVKEEFASKADFDSLDIEKGEGKTLYDKYKVDGLPAVLFFNAKGKMVRKHEGTWTEAELKKAVNKVIR